MKHKVKIGISLVVGAAAFAGACVAVHKMGQLEQCIAIMQAIPDQPLKPEAANMEELRFRQGKLAVAGIVTAECVKTQHRWY